MASMQDRHDFISRVAKLTKDPEDKLEVINSAAKLGKGLTANKRLALASGYQDLVQAKIAKWRIVSKIQYAGDMHFVALAKEYLKRVGDEITEKCNEILLTINNYLLPSSKTGEAAVLYYKMKGDYYSILAEVKTHADRKEAKSESLKAYEAATTIAKSDLRTTNPIRLRLALNFSAFLYEIMANTERARNMATQAFEDVAAKLDSLDQHSHLECSLIMQMIKDNLARWTPDPGENEVLRPPPPPEWFIEVDCAIQMDSNFTNKNDPWEYNLDIDDSDLHLTPVMHSSSSAHVEPSPYTPNIVTIIPGPAGVVQLSNSICVEPSSSTPNPVRIIPGPAGLKVVEDVGEDADFNSEAWVSATNYVNAFGGTVTGCLGDIANFLKKEKLEQVVAIVKSCSSNALGDLNATLKNLSVFTPKPSKHYLNITKRNVVEVFRKDTVSLA
nr:hypothetical protein [Tanacetum cinerariifolium]